MKSVSPSVRLPEMEEGILEHWQKNNSFNQSLKIRKDAPEFLFYDGPPFSSGLPHHGHLLAGTIKDIIPRYQTMNGKYVERRFGWDTHGLPIEMIIERELELNGRTDILEYGVDKFNEACRAGVLRYVDEWRKVTTRLGRWIDFDNDYKTMDLSFMESVWWVFKQLWDKGRIYEGLRVMPYSWRLATPLSNFEAGNNYKEVSDPAITVRFRIKQVPSSTSLPKDMDLNGASLLAWTTTPWTLPSNLGLCVHSELDYVVVTTESEGERLILAKERLAAYFNSGKKKESSGYTIEKELKGKDLVGLVYEPLFNYFQSLESEGAFRVVSDDYVTTTDGTGIVHLSPAHGEDDFRVGQTHNIPIVDPVDNEGNFTNDVPDVCGENIKEADKKLIALLKESGKLFRQESITHSYPFCERSDTPLIYKAISAWYVKVEDLREKMVAHNQQIHWVPEHIRDGRFGNWLAQARDWNISRNRFWGNPLPIWRCDDCGELECVGSIQELEERAKEKVADLHKHFVDKLQWQCEKCPGTMTRIPEVLDCWFESGSMPYAQAHYPFENRERFEKAFPADFIAEGLDQTRGWFYTLMILGTTLFDSTPFKNCIVNGLILAEDGKKMSKRLKNYADPMYIMEEYGADALRLFLINSPVVKGESLRFSESGVKDIVRSVLLPLWNVYSFFTTYGVIDDFKVASEPTPSSNTLDRWIVSRMQSLLGRIEEEMAEYRLYTVVPLLLDFIEDLTNWYVRRSRRRFWSDDATDKNSGYQTLFDVLMTFSKAVAPFLPFTSEEIFQNLSSLKDEGLTSVHLSDYPKSQEALIDTELEREMALIQETVRLGRTLRARLKIRNRQPLQSVTVVTTDERDAQALEQLGSHIQAELNVKEVLFSSDEAALVDLTIKPDFPVCGPIFQKDMGKLTKALASLGSDAIKTLEQGGTISVLEKELDSSMVQIKRSAKEVDMEIETSAGVTVYFDTEITKELLSEGLAREFINRVQRLRKEADFHISDRISIHVAPTDDSALLMEALTAWRELIGHEVLAKELNLTGESPSSFDISQDTEIEGHAIKLFLTKV